MFTRTHQGLEFTVEMPDEDSLQFSDIEFMRRAANSWERKKRRKTSFLPCDSVHLKALKRTISAQ